MINLKVAYKNSEKLKRNPKDVKINRYAIRKVNDNIRAIGVFKDSKGDLLKCKIYFPFKPGRKKIPIFKTTKEIGMQPLSADTKFQGEIDCECMDYLYTFYSAVSKKEGNSKRRIVPKAKGTGVTRHVDKPGMCKHLMALFNILNKEKFIKQ